MRTPRPPTVESLAWGHRLVHIQAGGRTLGVSFEIPVSPLQCLSMTEGPSGLLQLCLLLWGLWRHQRMPSPCLQAGRQMWRPWLCKCTPHSPDSRFLGHIWPAVSWRLLAPAPWWKSPIWAIISMSYCILRSSVYKTSRTQTDRGAYIYGMKIMSLKCKKLNNCHYCTFYWALSRHQARCFTWIISRSHHSHLLTGALVRSPFNGWGNWDPERRSNLSKPCSFQWCCWETGCNNRIFRTLWCSLPGACACARRSITKGKHSKPPKTCAQRWQYTTSLKMESEEQGVVGDFIF